MAISICFYHQRLSYFYLGETIPFIMAYTLSPDTLLMPNFAEMFCGG